MRISDWSSDVCSSRSAIWRALREDGSTWPSESHPVPATLRTGEPSIGLVMGVERVGRPTLWLSLSAQPVRDQAGDIDGVVLTFTDITSQREAERALRTSEQRIDEATEALQWQAFHDPLTKLPNRALLMERVTTAVERGRDDGTPTALLYRDLDRLPTVNVRKSGVEGKHVYGR